MKQHHSPDSGLDHILWERFGLVVDNVEPVEAGTETTNTLVQLDGGQRVFVKEYPRGADLDQAQAACDMAQYCRDAGIAVPRIWPDRDGCLLSRADRAECRHCGESVASSAWVVLDEAPGHPAQTPMTVERAHSIGVALGRMHRTLVSYPGRASVRQTRWRTLDVATAVEKTNGILEGLGADGGFGAERWRAAQLLRRCQDLLTQVGPLRAGLPGQLVSQPLHADFSRTNVLIHHDRMSAVIDFQAQTGVTAWELGRAAFDPRTIAGSDRWMEPALALVSAYRTENPGLPAADFAASARITVLYLLFSFYGAQAEPGYTPQAQRELQRYWDERQLTIRCLLDHLDEVEDRLAEIAACPGRRVAPSGTARAPGDCTIVHLVIKREDQVLLGKRPDVPSGQGQFELPTGRPKDGESATGCAVRQAREDLGVVIDEADLELVHALHRRDPAGGTALRLYFRVTSYEGQPKATAPHTDRVWQWFPASALPDPLAHATRTALAAMTAGDACTFLKSES